MTAETQRAEIVARLLAARQGGPLLDSSGIGLEQSDAYAIQAEVMAALGPVGGWKVGRGTPEEAIIFAPIPAAAILPTPQLWTRAASRLGGLELEIAFRIDAPLPALDAPDFARQLTGCVTPLPAFEVVDCRLHDPDQAAPLWRLADFQINAGLIIGPALEGPWQPDDFICPPGLLIADASVIAKGLLTLPSGSPFDLLTTLLRQVGNHCGGVQPGQIVTTGSFTGLRFFRPGTRLRGRIAGMAPLEMMFGV